MLKLIDIVWNGILLHSTFEWWDERDAHRLARLLDILGSFRASHGDHTRVVVVVESASAAERRERHERKGGSAGSVEVCYHLCLVRRSLINWLFDAAARW
jgi:hypothetical protein